MIHYLILISLALLFCFTFDLHYFTLFLFVLSEFFTMLSGDAQCAQDGFTILVLGLLLYRVKAEAGK